MSLSLSLKGLVEKVYRAFKMSVGVLVGFSFVALYVKLKLTINDGATRTKLGGLNPSALSHSPHGPSVLYVYTVQPAVGTTGQCSFYT